MSGMDKTRSAGLLARLMDRYCARQGRQGSNDAECQLIDRDAVSDPFLLADGSGRTAIDFEAGVPDFFGERPRFLAIHDTATHRWDLMHQRQLQTAGDCGGGNGSRGVAPLPGAEIEASVEAEGDGTELSSDVASEVNADGMDVAEEPDATDSADGVGEPDVVTDEEEPIDTADGEQAMADADNTEGTSEPVTPPEIPTAETDAGDVTTGPAWVVPPGLPFCTNADANSLYMTMAQMAEGPFVSSCIYLQLGDDPTGDFDWTAFGHPLGDSLFVQFAGLVPMGNQGTPLPSFQGDWLFFNYEADSFEDTGDFFWTAFDDVGNAVQATFHPGDPVAGIAAYLDVQFLEAEGLAAYYQYPCSLPNPLLPEGFDGCPTPEEENP